MTPTIVLAHFVTTGLGPLYDGISHVLVSPDDLLPILAVGLLAGLNGAAAGRRALFVLPSAWLLGGVLGLAIGGPVLPAGAAAISSLLVGALVAASPILSPAMVMALAGAVGVLHGWLNGTALAIAVRATAARIALRVAGSWIAAIGLLMLGWSLRRP